MSLIELEEENRIPIKQMKASRQIVYDEIEKSNTDLLGRVQKALAVSQERTCSLKETLHDFSAEIKKADQYVTESFAEFEKEWASLNTAVTPTGFDDDLQKLKNSCEEVLKQKSDLIRELTNELVKRDHEYVNTNAEQNDQIHQYVMKMREFDQEIRKKVNSEIAAIFSAFDQERTLMLSHVLRETKSIQMRRAESERKLTADITSHSNTIRDELEELRQNSHEEHMKLRTDLETKLQALEKQFQGSLGKYIFSLEKLDYEMRTLSDVQDEHHEKEKLQQKKIGRQRETIRLLRKKYEEEDLKFKKENKKYTDEYAKTTENYRQLQEKFRKVAFSDFNVFREVWNMNEKSIHEQVLILLDADRIIMEQVLGKKTPSAHPDFLKRKIIGTEDFEDLTKTPQAPPAQDSDQSKTIGSNLLQGTTFSEPLSNLWKLISNEVGFLVDERVKSLLGFSPSDNLKDSQVMIRRDVLLQDLGITSKEDVELLLSYFLRDTEFGEIETPGFVRPFEVLEGLNNFVKAFSPNVQEHQTNLFAQIMNDPTQNTSSEVARAIMQLQGKMRKQMSDHRGFLERKMEVVTEDMWRIWNATFRMLQKYVSELEERAKLVLETEDLRTQNQEYEQILSQYIHSSANYDLIYPPDQTVDFFV